MVFGQIIKTCVLLGALAFGSQGSSAKFIQDISYNSFPTLKTSFSSSYESQLIENPKTKIKIGDLENKIGIVFTNEGINIKLTENEKEYAMIRYKYTRNQDYTDSEGDKQLFLFVPYELDIDKNRNGIYELDEYIPLNQGD